MPKRPTKAAKAATKGKTAPAKVRRLGGPPAAKAGHDEEQIEVVEPPPTKSPSQLAGEAAIESIAFHDAGFELAEDIAAGDGHLQISLEALGLWLAGLVDSTDGRRVARWRLIPEECFTIIERKPFKRWRDAKRKQPRAVVRNAQELRLKSEGREWLWQELARTAGQDGEADTAKTLCHLIGSHKEAAERLMERFLAAQHSIQNEVKKRLLTTAQALASGDPDRIAKAPKEDLDRLRREHRPEG
jgi:hypothetical protein